MSNSWTAGYVADIGYTYGYYTELNPVRTRLPFAYHGIELPTEGVACELGFGQGLSTVLHAAGSSSNWWGTDFNPSQTAFARDISKFSGGTTHLFDQSFEEFCHRSDLPEFDYIGLHGIWSWISDENRKVIVNFINKKLKVGGVLYISYNTLPGWAAFAPMRHLMTEHAEVLGAEGRGIVSRIEGAIDFADQMLLTNPLFVRANPLIGERLKKMKEQNKHYLAHEYFNRDWHPMHFAKVAEWLEPAKVQYACSANYLDAVDAVNLTQEQQAFLAAIPDPMFRQTVRDFMVNQQFRKDYWVKGIRKMSPLSQAEVLRNVRVLLCMNKEDVGLKVNGALGEAALNEDVYVPIIDYLSDHKSKSLAEIHSKVNNLTFAQVLQAVMVLSGAGYVTPIQDDVTVSKSRRHTQSINNHLIGRAKASNDIQYLSSPVTGGGFPVTRFQQLFLQCIADGKKTPAEWAKFVWSILDAQGQRIFKDGKTLESAEENIQELMAQGNQFASKQLPILKALQIA